MQFGSITPYYAGWTSGVDHYVYTDGTGAQYRLDQNNSGVWTSLCRGFTSGSMRTRISYFFPMGNSG